MEHQPKQQSSRMLFFCHAWCSSGTDRTLSMKTWDNIDIFESKYGTGGTIYHHIEGWEIPRPNFESAGCGVEPLRVRSICGSITVGNRHILR